MGYDKAGSESFLPNGTPRLRLTGFYFSGCREAKEERNAESVHQLLVRRL